MPETAKPYRIHTFLVLLMSSATRTFLPAQAAHATGYWTKFVTHLTKDSSHHRSGQPVSSTLPILQIGETYLPLNRVRFRSTGVQWYTYIAPLRLSTIAHCHDAIRWLLSRQRILLSLIPWADSIYTNRSTLRFRIFTRWQIPSCRLTKYPGMYGRQLE